MTPSKLFPLVTGEMFARSIRNTRGKPNRVRDAIRERISTMTSTKPVTRIKDMPETQSLGGVRFIYPRDGKAYYWHSQWEKGVWGKRSLGSEQIFPLFCADLKEALEWVVVKAEGKAE